MKAVERMELLKDAVQQAVDNGATNVEQVHQYIAALPFETLEKLGFFEAHAAKVKDKQAETIAIAYDAVRTINRQVGRIFSDIFGQIEDVQIMAKNMAKRGRRD
jgi:hypothetical protein